LGGIGLGDIISRHRRTWGDHFQWPCPNPEAQHGARNHLPQFSASTGTAFVFYKAVEEPYGLLEWLAKDRAMVTFTGVDDVRGRQSALQRVVRQWITHV